MAKSELRIQYSGLIIFAAQLISVATGFGFILLLTRSTTTDEYGVWSNIFDVTGYFVLFSGLVPFWATRFVARAKEGATRTALLANFVIGLAAAAVYISLVPSITAGLHINDSYVPVYLLASAQLTTVFLVGVLESCLRARKPQAIGYGLLVEEVVKLSLAFVLIVLLHPATPALLFVYAMLSLIVSASVQTLYYIRLLWSDLRLRVRWSYIKEWLKGSAAILYNAAGNQIGTYVFIMLFVYGSETARGDYQASATFAAIIGYSLSLAFALYPKLLAENSLHEITTSLRTVLLFAFPLAAIMIATSQSLLTVLKVAYSDAWPVLIVLALDAVIVLIMQFYTSVLYGIEKLDEEAKIPLRKLLKSRMFRLLSIPYLQAAITLPATFIILTRYTVETPVQAATYVALILLFGHLVTLSVTGVIVGKVVRIEVPWQSTGKYALTSAITAIVLYLAPHPRTLILTCTTVVAGAALYGAMTLLFDSYARNLVQQTLRELGRRGPDKS